MKFVLLFVCLLSLGGACPPVGAEEAAPSGPADWQFAIDVPGTKSKAYLWIPPTCRYVRGAILGQQVILENKVLEDPAIRQVATEENLALVLICPGCLGYFEYKKNPSVIASLQGIFDALAEVSGYGELVQAPLLPIGHSGNGIFAWNLAYWNPGRIIGVVGLHCMSSDAPAGDPKATIEGVPILDISGQYELWANPHLSLEAHWRWLRGGLLELRGHYDRALVSELVDPGGCHFSFNPPMAQYVALFIRKAAESRLPEAPPADPSMPVMLRTIPAQAGWLTDITLLTPSRYAPAPIADFKNDPALAFWHFDREMANATEAYRREAREKRDQRLTFVQDGAPLPAEWLETLKFQPLGDGQTVRVQAAFLHETPSGVAESGRPLGHARGPIQFSLIGGWRGGGEQIGPDTFRLAPGHLGPTDNLMILATQAGNGIYAWAEQPAQIKYPLRNTVGAVQKITFAPLANQPKTIQTLTLDAVADSGLPVGFYLVRGPAVVEGNRLVFQPIPPRARLPLQVTVVAYQWGRTLGAPIQSAAPVEQSFYLEKAK